MSGQQVNRFSIEASAAELDDLRQRLQNTRWPDAETPDDWSQGVPLTYLQSLCTYWAEEYDWRAREAALNRFDQFTTELDAELADGTESTAHPFHSPALSPRERPPPDHDPRVARINRRILQGDRAAHQSNRTRRHGTGRLPCGVPIAPRLWLFRKTRKAGLWRAEHCEAVECADVAPGL